MSAKTATVSPRQRILATALDLFYRQGYMATGINQIIDEADVARASFYDHFPSKEDLLLAYAVEISRKELGEIRQQVSLFPTAKERFFGPFDILYPWFEISNYRGCPFQNMMAEVPPNAQRVQQVAQQHREFLRSYIVELALDLKTSDPAFSHIDPQEIAIPYLLLFEGALSLAVAYRKSWPVDHGKEALLALIQRRSSR